jgi:DNA-binding NarL/FixJ family response regulator
MRVLIIDDHELFRAGLKALLFELDPNIQAAQAGTLTDGLSTNDSSAPFDLILLDMNLPDVRGLEALSKVREAFEGVPVVVMSAIEDPRFIRSTIEAGACGYIPKTTTSAVTVLALKLVLEQGVYLPADYLLQDDEQASAGTATTSMTTARAVFSERQLEVLQRLLQGKPNKVIARELAIAEGTVKAHLAAIYQVLNVTTRTQAMYKVHELGLSTQFTGISR